MTECERIIKSGRISADFLKEEVRCDFFVDTERKKLWLILLDLLLELDRICKKHGLKYYLWAGSLLGAVRHQGFIPWDDDMDVAMLREDYEKLKEVAYEFEHPYFLQYPHTDPEAGYSHIKIRNSNTTAFNKLFSYRNYNFGIYLDIFPIDNYHEEGQRERFDRIEAINVENSLYMKMKSPYANDWDKYRFERHSGKSVIENFDEIERISTMYRYEPSDKGIKLSGPAIKNMDRVTWPYDQITQSVELPFEGFLFSCPSGWDEYLRKSYGDYMQFPPIEKRSNKHAHTITEPDVPYKEFVKPPYEPYVAYVEYGKRKLAEALAEQDK